jgi:hypothetical protein
MSHFAENKEEIEQSWTMKSIIDHSFKYRQTHC